MSWVYKQTELAEPGFAGLWTVGHYDGEGRFIPESDHHSPDEAAERVRYLNGGDATLPVVFSRWYKHGHGRYAEKDND